MVKETEPEYRYTMANESELDTLLSGHMVEHGIVLGDLFRLSTPKIGETGVVWIRDDESEIARPLLLITHEDDVRRLCGRYAQLRNDLSPLTAWCHLVTPKFSAPLDNFVRKSSLGGMEAAWTGLIIAETMLLSERPISTVRISACLATQSFAIARVNSLWQGVSIDEILRRFDSANQICRNASAAQREENRVGKLRTSLRAIWAVLIGCIFPEGVQRNELTVVVTALHSLHRARLDHDANEAYRLAEPLLDLVPEAEGFKKFVELTPEMRLRLFDMLVSRLADTGEHATVQRTALAVLAGYVATVAAGGAPSLTLAEHHVLRWPEITAWAYLIGGIGESVVWTSGFDGLGRLVARELSRPLRLNEPPVCDFGFEEVAVLADSALADPLVHLRVKQARLVTVALYPGANISIPIAEPHTASVGRYEPSRTARGADAPARDPMITLADSLWPHIQARLDRYLNEFRQQKSEYRQGTIPRKRGGRKKSGLQPQLPLSNNPKRE